VACGVWGVGFRGWCQLLTVFFFQTTDTSEASREHLIKSFAEWVLHAESQHQVRHINSYTHALHVHPFCNITLHYCIACTHCVIHVHPLCNALM